MYDAIIVGARAAGSPAAMLLARRGYRVLALERDRFPSDHLSTHLVKAAGAAALRRWGLLGRVLGDAHCSLIPGARYDIAGASIEGSAFGTGQGVADLAPRRVHLDDTLARAAVEAGVELLEGFTVDGLVFDGTRVVGVQGRGPGGEIAEFRAPIVIGADGHDSIVARLTRAPEYRAAEPLAGMFYSYFSGVDVRVVETFVREGRTIHAFPTSDDQVLLSFAVPAAEFETTRRGIEDAFWATLEQAPDLLERVRKGRREARWYAAPPARNFFRKPYGDGWALIGDAGYMKDPVTGWGLTDAFLDAEHLVEAIDDARSARMTWEAAMSRYERLRNQRALPYYEQTLAAAQCAAPGEREADVFHSIAASVSATREFLGTLSGTVSPAAFWTIESIAALRREALIAA